jgi:sulfopyruvate decarboxylase subunit beta
VAAVIKTEAIRAVIDATADESIVYTTGHACRIAHAVNDRPTHFYMTGSMGLASSIAIGIAQQTNHTTVVVDGDGSVLMNPVGLIIAGGMISLPLVHVLLDDRAYAPTGGQRVPSAEVGFAALARSCGYRRVLRADDAGELTTMLRSAVRTCTSPTFVHCVLAGEDLPVPPRVDLDLAEHATRFSAAVGELARR